MKRVIQLAVIALVLAAAAWAGWQYFGPREVRAVPTTVAVTRGDIEQTVLASGTLEASSVTSIGAQVSGRIETLHVAIGDTVAKGDTIAEIDSLDQENKVKSAQASLANMTAQRKARASDVATAQAALDRATRLQKQNLVSDADLQGAEAALQNAQAQVDALDAQISQAELAVESAKLDLSRTQITSPVAGTVVAVLVTEGQSVNSAQSSPTIVKIADLDTMVIKAQISEADVTRVQPGQSAYFTILGDPTRRIDATLKSIEPAPDAIATADSGVSGSDNAIYYNGLFEVDNANHQLRIAMTAQVTIVVEAATDTLLIPAGALAGGGPNGASGVGVYDPATKAVARTRIRVGINNNIFAQVLDGLKEGDLVITERPTGAGATPGGGGSGGRRTFGGGGPVLIGPGPGG